jgi:hypothetical protein
MESIFDRAWAEIQKKVRFINSLSSYDIIKELKRIIQQISMEYSLSKEDVYNMLLDSVENRAPKLVRVIESSSKSVESRLRDF